MGCLVVFIIIIIIIIIINIMFIEIPEFNGRFYSPVNPLGSRSIMSSMVSLPNHTFTGQA